MPFTRKTNATGCRSLVWNAGRRRGFLLSHGREHSAASFISATCGKYVVKDVGENETDSLDDIGLHLYYDDEGRLEFVEAFHPADISFQGVRFLGRDVSAVTRDMNALGFGEIVADVGIDFPDAGIALTAPSGVIEGVAAHRKGYYA